LAACASSTYAQRTYGFIVKTEDSSFVRKFIGKGDLPPFAEYGYAILQVTKDQYDAGFGSVSPQTVSNAVALVEELSGDFTQTYTMREQAMLYMIIDQLNVIRTDPKLNLPPVTTNNIMQALGQDIKKAKRPKKPKKK
jgi:hypothetical protein